MVELYCLNVDDLLLLRPDDPGAVQGGGVLTGKVLLLLGYVRCTCNNSSNKTGKDCKQVVNQTGYPETNVADPDLVGFGCLIPDPDPDLGLNKSVLQSRSKEPHLLVGAGAVTRCGSSSDNGIKHG
jgi:hypothetical protein